MARATNQPSFDFLTGAELAPANARREPLRESFRQSSAPSRENNAHEELRAQLKRLQYELEAIKAERELSAIQHQQEIRTIQERAETDFKRAQNAQHGGENAARKLEALQREHQDVQSRSTNEKLALEKKVREVQADNRNLREELEEVQAELAESGRRHQHAHKELSQRHDTLQASVEEIQSDLVAKTNSLQSTQQRLTQQESVNGELEAEILRLKAQTGDSDTLEIIRKELSDQVNYIKKLEATNRNQEQQLKCFRSNSKNVEVVEEEKRALEVKLRMMDDLRQELAEAELQKRILQDEKRGWTTYLEAQDDSHGKLAYNTPEELAKGFMQERLERLDLLDQIGRLQPELDVREDNIKALTEELADLRVRLDSAKPDASSGQADSKARARLERQKTLALKEVEYLRAQMKSFEAEETEFALEEVDEQGSTRVRELEELLDQYRTELQTVHADLSKREALITVQTPRKRAREDDGDNDNDDNKEAERSAEMRRRLKAMQHEAQKLHSRTQVLEAELKASTSQIAMLKESSRTRVLELRNNPTAEAEAIKVSTLRTLREENAALLAQLQEQQPANKLVPAATLDNFQQQLDEAREQLAKMDKKTLRLKQIWSSKALEFREAVASILGWKLDFLPNGTVKATSILYESTIVDGEEQENSIVFDGEKGTMKISGGPKSMFAREIQGHIDFWVEGRKEVPCFLAACTLEFYERTTRAQKM